MVGIDEMDSDKTLSQQNHQGPMTAGTLVTEPQRGPSSTPVRLVGVQEMLRAGGGGAVLL